MSQSIKPTGPFIEALEYAEKALADRFDQINKLRLILRAAVEAYDRGSLEMSSPDIPGIDDVAPHPWHEEWIFEARKAMDGP